MAYFHSPRIITDGLVLALDAANIKSFRGEPTVNLLLEPTRTHTGGMGSYWSGIIGLNNIEKGLPSFKITTVNNDRLDGFITSNSGNLINGTTYTWSADVWVPLGKTIQIGMRRITGGSRVSGSTLNVNGSGTWIRVSRTFVADSNTSGSIEGNEQNLVTDVYSFWIRNLQLEQKPYPTPFVNGTRGTTVATGGGWADRSGNGNHGELVNGPTFNSGNGGSLVFDGVDDTVNFNYDLRSDWTYECWVLHNVVNGFSFLGQGTTTTRNGLHIWFRSATDLRFGMFSNDTDASSITTLTGVWYHYCFTYNHSTFLKQIYRNGIQLNTTPIQTQTSYLGTGIVRIGSTYSSGGAYANGLISKSKLYNRALTPEEILQNYNATKGRYGL